ncbi:MAG: ATP-dependent Clp protease ATP-binding subunit [Alistipes sp.]|jgi:ATP-dependent Clp protease ATP-binding subunit ClpC|nr:ATP-dependent Clp protease ATP-binding subunit [Alistipes sp.]
MQRKRSRLLENLIAIAAFDAEKSNHGTHLLDRLFLLMLGQEDCHAMRILRSRLMDWELYQIKLRVEREIEQAEMTAKPVRREEFYRDLIFGLAELAAIRAGARLASDIANEDATADAETKVASGAGVSVKPNTGHLLIYALSVPASIAGRILGMYHIMADDVSRDLVKFPDDELLESEIRTARRRANKSDGACEDASTDNSGHDEAPDDQQTEPSRLRDGAKPAMLEKYGVDLTRAAAEGRVDPVVGRGREMERMLQILGRRKKNNPVLVGDAGVGKSAIVEGLALKIATGDAPAGLKDKKIFSLDIASLVAGTKFRGEFEERIKTVFDELARRKDTIVFIDEVHTIVGAGSTQGSLDTANILKPALARGDVQCIGATTMDEYRENIEKDAALERRFQKIVIEPASAEQTLEILRNIKTQYEKHHSVVYADDALVACVELTGRYVTDRCFPDKAIDALDEAGSRAHARECECECDGNSNGKNNGQGQGDDDREPTQITAAHIEETITTMTGIPVERISQSEGARLIGLETRLAEAVVGQAEAVRKVSRSIVRSRSGLRDPNKPIGVFMFVGPTGVGKTLLAKELAHRMFDRPDSLIRIDMSEYSEKHNVSRLIGSPPGYVGYGEGGQLTEAVRRQPYAVVLLDEMEKAHPDVFNVMLQMLDDGHMTDGLGRRIDFRNTIVIMTSNAGSAAIARKAPAVGYGTSAMAAAAGASREAEYRNALTQTFAPEFMGRVDDIAVFNALEADDIARVVELELATLVARAEKLGFGLEISEEVRRELAAPSYDPEYGVRSLKRAILDRVEEPLAQMIVAGGMKPGDRIEVGLSGERIELSVKTA